MSRRLAASLTVLLLPVLATAGVAASVRPQPRETTGEQQLARRLPAPDLALAGGARHLRMPSLEERWAPFHDSPGLLDVDPAGGFFRPTP